MKLDSKIKFYIYDTYEQENDSDYTIHIIGTYDNKKIFEDFESSFNREKQYYKGSYSEYDLDGLLNEFSLLLEILNYDKYLINKIFDYISGLYETNYVRQNKCVKMLEKLKDIEKSIKSKEPNIIKKLYYQHPDENLYNSVFIQVNEREIYKIYQLPKASEKNEEEIDFKRYKRQVNNMSETSESYYESYMKKRCVKEKYKRIRQKEDLDYFF